MLVVLSPHLDDAVLSCWTVLTGSEEVVVLNVFTGAPESPDRVAWWDRLTDASASGERMEERRAEDAAALALAGRTAENLGLLEAQYRGDATPGLLDGAISDAIPKGARLLAPVGFGGHEDHLLVRDAALRLVDLGHEVMLYAELPHAIERGWPSWVDSHARQTPEVDEEWRAQLGDAVAGPWRPTVHELDRDTHASKLQAVRRYRTQFAALDAMSFRPLLRRETLRYEVFWSASRE